MCFAHGNVISTRMPGGRACIEEPARRRVINADDVQPDLAHQREIALDLFAACRDNVLPRPAGTARRSRP